MSSGSATFVTAVNLFQAGRQQALPSGLVEREGTVGSISSTPLPYRQSSVSRKPKPLSSRNRTYTAPSLYATFEKSLSEDNDKDGRSRSISSPENTSFSGTFMRSNSKLQPHPQHLPQRQSQDIPKLVADPECILPGPAKTFNPFDIGSIRAFSKAGRPAWWCRLDRLVVFDSIQTNEETGEKTFVCRTSKGLESSRSRCPKESVEVKLDCAHCRDMLNMEKWVYQARVKQLSVCHACKNRCMEEEERENEIGAAPILDVQTSEVEKQENRRDSFLAPSLPLTVEIHHTNTTSSDNKEIRKIQSEKHLRRPTVSSIDSVLHADCGRQDSRHEDPQLRRFRSENHLSNFHPHHPSPQMHGLLGHGN